MSPLLGKAVMGLIIFLSYINNYYILIALVPHV